MIQTARPSSARSPSPTPTRVSIPRAISSGSAAFITESRMIMRATKTIVGQNGRKYLRMRRSSCPSL